MTDEEIEELSRASMTIGNYLIVSMKMVRLVGYNATALLAYLMYKEQYFRDRKELQDGFFYNIIPDIEKGTHLTERKQSSALEKLEQLGVISTKISGMPAKKFYKINHLNIITLFQQNVITCSDKMSEHVPTKHTATIKSKLIKKPICASHITGAVAPVVRKMLIKKKILPRREMIKNGLKENLADKTKVREEKRKEKLHRVVDFDMQIIIDYWKKKGLTFHKEETKVYARSIDNLKSLLKGTLFNSFSNKTYHNRRFGIEEIKRAIDNFVLSAYNLDYEPSNKKYLQAIQFVDFFYSTRPCPREEDKSLFLKYMLTKPILLANAKIYVAKDIYPHATKILVDWYKKTFGNRDNGNYSMKNKNDLIYATQELKTFYDENKDRINLKDWILTYNQTDPVSFLAVQTTRAMDKMLRENENLYVSFTTGWLKTERTLQERLPLFLKQEHMMK